MSSSSPARGDSDGKPSRKRRYYSPLRQQQSADTRDKIIAAGVEMVHEFPTWDWTNLTARAVSQRAGVSERTVYRHFSTEQNLRDAVMQRLVENSGINLDDLQIEDFGKITSRMFQYLSAFAVATEPEQDPTLASMDQWRREKLMQAVQRSLADWKEEDQRALAGILDVLWHPAHYERLTGPWNIEPERAGSLIVWLINLALEAVEDGNRPG